MEIIGLVLSAVAGILIGIRVFDWFYELREENLREERERIDRQLKYQMEDIIRNQRYKAELYKMEEAKQKAEQEFMNAKIEYWSQKAIQVAEKKKQENENKPPPPDLSDPEILVIPNDWSVKQLKDGLIIMKRGKPYVYKDGRFEMIKTDPKQVFEDLWYGTGGR